jgi:hypothetical protein
MHLVLCLSVNLLYMLLHVAFGVTFESCRLDGNFKRKWRLRTSLSHMGLRCKKQVSFALLAQKLNYQTSKRQFIIK